MLEVKSRTHINRYFATELHWTDFFRVIHYFNYMGNKCRIPFFYLKRIGVSCVTDLSMSMDEIMRSMKSNTRNEIRRAIKEGCGFSVSQDVHEFVRFYNLFCKSKGLNDFATVWRIKKYKDFLITKATCNDVLLAMHVNVLDIEGKRAFLMFSCSQRLVEGIDKKMVGWGNRFLHYKDIEYLKEHGFLMYDWSGICLDTDDCRYSIGQFKLSFGGVVTKPLMLRTPLYACLEGIRNLLMKIRRRYA